MLLLHVTRASHLWLSFSFVSRIFCGMPAPWMVADRLTGKIVDTDTFFKHQNTPILFGTDEPAPPRHLVDVAGSHGFRLEYPSIPQNIASMPGKPGPPSHQYRFRRLSRYDYIQLCQLEDAIAMQLLPQDQSKIKIMTIVPSRFVMPDSVPSRCRGKGVTTMSMGSHSIGRFVLLPETNEACSSS